MPASPSREHECTDHPVLADVRAMISDRLDRSQAIEKHAHTQATTLPKPLEYKSVPKTLLTGLATETGLPRSLSSSTLGRSRECNKAAPEDGRCHRNFHFSLLLSPPLLNKFVFSSVAKLSRSISFFHFFLMSSSSSSSSSFEPPGMRFLPQRGMRLVPDFVPLRARVLW